MMWDIMEFIACNLDKCLRRKTEDEDTLIGLPYPYSVPCVGSDFQEMYYWDTYFTNIGFLLGGNVEQAIYHAENMAFLIRKFGYMPNGSRTYYLGRSQPPFFSQMVRDIYESTEDRKWLSRIYDAVETEYEFWNMRRRGESGLYHYGPEVPEERVEPLFDYFSSRIGADTADVSKREIAQTTLIGCESGWDFNPRWGVRAADFAQIDLNALVYGMQKNMEFFCRILDNGKQDFYESQAARHLENCRRHMLTPEGLYQDLNERTGQAGSVFSCASYYPLVFFMADEKQALAARDHLGRLEQEYGLAACEKQAVKGVYQWHYPNGWAPLHYMVIKGLLNYGFQSDAVRIAVKFRGLVEKTYRETGNLWEKYNVCDGSVNVVNEYAMPPMMGWTCGVYLYCRKIVEDYHGDCNRGR